MIDFIEYTDNGDNYIEPERNEVSEIISIRLYCQQKNRKQYILGKEGYNGFFVAETGQKADLRNQCWYCNKHQDIYEAQYVDDNAISHKIKGKTIRSLKNKLSNLNIVGSASICKIGDVDYSEGIIWYKPRIHQRKNKKI